MTKKLSKLLKRNGITNLKLLSADYQHLFTAYNKITGTDIVIKKYEIHKDFLNEMEIMQRILQENDKSNDYYVPIPIILGFFAYHKKKIPIYCLMMEKINAIDLMSHLENNNLNKLNRFKIMKRLVEIIYNLHKIGIVHRDIKCENILIDLPNTNSIESKINMTLIDFAYSKYIIKNKKENVRAGTMNYYSPELFFCGKYNPKANDVWSIGVIIYVLASKGYYPLVYGLRPVKEDRRKVKKYFYKYQVSKIRFDIIDTDLILVLKKIFVPESKRIKIGDLKKIISPIINKIIMCAVYRNTDDVINMSPKRHVLHATL
jgi:serine/threonine protein kinase